MTRTELRPYLGLRSGQEYLEVLEDVVGVPSVSVSPMPLLPLALPEAFDHLDLPWRLLTKKRLVQIPRAMLAAKLTLPATSGEEFESRLSGLADLLASMTVSVGELLADSKPMTRLRAELQRRLGDQAGPALEAVHVAVSG